MPKTRVANKTTDFSAKSVTFTPFVAGKPDAAKAFAAKLDGLAADIVTRLALHGLSQKLGDTYADGDNPIAGVQAAYANLKAGDWSVRGEAGPRDTILVEALAKIHPKTEATFKTDRDAAIATVRELLDATIMADAKKANVATDNEEAFEKFTNAYLKDLRAKPAVKAEMKAISARRATEEAKVARDVAKGVVGGAGLGF